MNALCEAVDCGIVEPLSNFFEPCQRVNECSGTGLHLTQRFERFRDSLHFGSEIIVNLNVFQRAERFSQLRNTAGNRLDGADLFQILQRPVHLANRSAGVRRISELSKLLG